MFIFEVRQGSILKNANGFASLFLLFAFPLLFIYFPWFCFVIMKASVFIREEKAIVSSIRIEFPQQLVAHGWKAKLKVGILYHLSCFFVIFHSSSPASSEPQGLLRTLSSSWLTAFHAPPLRFLPAEGPLFTRSSFGISLAGVGINAGIAMVMAV
jgi:hypothetical protein